MLSVCVRKGGGNAVRKVSFAFLIVLFLLGSSGCSIFSSEDEVTIKTVKKKPNTLFTNDPASEDLSGILQEKPGKYPKDDDKYWGTLPKKSLKDLKSLPPNMDADTAFNQLIYLFGRDYKQLQLRLIDMDTEVPVSDARKNAPESKEKLTVNIVVVVDAGKEMAKQIPGTKRTKMDLVKLKLKNSLGNLKEDQKPGISYQVMLQTYGAKLGKFTSKPVPIDQLESQIFPMIDEIIPGSVGSLTDALDSVRKNLKTESGGDVLNQVFVITAGKDGIESSPVTAAYNLLRSDAQAQVHVMDYGITDQKVKDRLELMTIRALGEYITTNPDAEAPFDFTDQTDFNEDGYNPREYLMVKETKWADRMTEMKAEQIEIMDTLYGEEYEHLKIAAGELKMNEAEKQFLLEKIENRKKILSNFIDKKIEEARKNLDDRKRVLGVSTR